jgi:hypothetical protein
VARGAADVDIYMLAVVEVVVAAPRAEHELAAHHLAQSFIVASLMSGPVHADARGKSAANNDFT